MRQLRKPFQHTQTLVIAEVREQIQEDIITFMDDKFVEDGWDAELLKENLCQIVVDKFKRLED